MEELIRPSFDECLFKIDYYQYAILLTQGRRFSTSEEVINHLLAMQKSHIESIRNTIPEEAYHKLKDLNKTSFLNKFKQEDFITFFQNEFQNKLTKLSGQIGISSDKQVLLERAIFNYFVSLKIEFFFRKQSFVKKIEQDNKNATNVITSFEASMDKFLEVNDVEKIDHEIRTIIRKNIHSFKMKMRADIEQEATGLKNSELDDPLAFVKDYLENSLFKTILKPGRKPSRSTNELILNLYKIAYDPEDFTYLAKVKAILDFINVQSSSKIDGIELSEGAVRKRIKDLLKIEREQEEIIAHNSKILLKTIELNSPQEAIQ